MNIFAHYPFEALPLPYPINSLEPFLDCQTLVTHYNEIYIPEIKRLNMLIKPYSNIYNWCLEELLFNLKSLPNELSIQIKSSLETVYNHQIYFYSFTNQIVEPFPSPLISSIINKYQSIENFYQVFTKEAMLITGGYLWLVCNELGEVMLYPSILEETTVEKNLYQIMGIDLWEHAYFNKYHTNKALYITMFLRHLNWNYLNNEYLECLKFKK